MREVKFCPSQILIREENTIALSAVTLAGAYLSFLLQVLTHFSRYGFKFKTTDSITELILDPDSDGDFLTMTNLAVMRMTTWHDKEEPVASSQRVYIPGQKIRQMEGAAQDKYFHIHLQALRHGENRQVQ
jgi:hypothetical protein